MGFILFLLGLLGMVVAIVLFVIALLKRKPKLTSLIIFAISISMAFVGLMLLGSEEEPENKEPDTQETDKGDIDLSGTAKELDYIDYINGGKGYVFLKVDGVVTIFDGKVEGFKTFYVKNDRGEIFNVYIKEDHEHYGRVEDGKTFDFYGIMTDDTSNALPYIQALQVEPKAVTEKPKPVEPKPEGPKEEKPKPEENAVSGYQAIYDKWSAEIKRQAPDVGMTELAEITNEGVSEMAAYMYKAKGKDGQYATYELWAGKLYDVYLEEAR